jgi:3',5'-cyclic AMP phosphodiesterase CpdA
MASGRLGRGQMLRAAALLERLGGEGYCRIVLIHHPPLPGMTDWYRALHDARAFGKVLSDHGAELVLHGHNHRVMMTGLEGRSGPIPIIGAPSASVASAEPAKRAGYNLFTIDRDGDGPWRISMKSRSFDLDGQPTEINQNLLP